MQFPVTVRNPEELQGLCGLRELGLFGIGSYPDLTKLSELKGLTKICIEPVDLGGKMKLEELESFPPLETLQIATHIRIDWTGLKGASVLQEILLCGDGFRSAVEKIISLELEDGLKLIHTYSKEDFLEHWRWEIGHFLGRKFTFSERYLTSQC